MSKREWIPVRQVMRTDVTMVNGRMDVLDALRTMKRVPSSRWLSSRCSTMISTITGSKAINAFRMISVDMCKVFLGRGA